MDDLIKRQDAIEYFMTNTNWHDEEGYPIEDAEDKRALLTDYFNGVPTAQQWIPCSERLPEKLEDVVICFADAPDEADVAYMRKTFNKTYKSQGVENEFVSHMGETTYADYEVLAWMPLPKPWKGE